ncbi:MAG: preprotein translocase subunit SecA [Schleiferiaceae bacterium]|nr:preprotein translocase subunit SecA [Schleiferiaceae bacterium]
MISKILGKLFGSKADKDIKLIQPYLDAINRVAPAIASLSNDALRNKSLEFRQKIEEATNAQEQEIAALRVEIDAEENIDQKELLYNQIDTINKAIVETTEKVLEDILPEAFAVMRETAKRFKENEWVEVTATDFDRALATRYGHIKIEGEKALWHNRWNAAGTEFVWDMVHYDVQLIGGTALHQGKIAEMATGEGKTLVATLPVYLNALPGKGVHVVTVNDYLAKRDSEWMGPIYQFHGLKVDCIDKHQPNSNERRNAYLADITFGTNNEFGFDYLRDNMARNPEELVQRGHNYAIVDEVDSVLIDDARTPLIISGPTPKGDLHEFTELKPFVVKLVAAQRAKVTEDISEAKRLIGEGDTEKGGFMLLRAYRGLPKNKALIKLLSQDGMRSLLQKVESVYMQEQSKNMWKVDQELYFTIDEKHNQIDLTEKGIQLLSDDTDADFFVMPDIAAEISELEVSELSPEEKKEKKEKFLRDFSVKSERIHTMNQLLKAYTVFEKDVEYVVMDNKVKIVDEQTGRIMEGRRYSDGLHQAIEAKENVKIEAATQTYATVTLQNYFRMYNKLSGMTGTAETEAGEFWEIYKLDVVVIPTNRPIARDDRQDVVYKTRREKFNAVIDEIEQLRNANRPILVGTTNVEVSELLSRSLKLRKVPHNVLNAKLHQKEAEIVAVAGQPGKVTIATNMAGRGTDIKLAAESKAAGGLAIIGTERHDSRRVDRQLRGRAGRQGDPGSSQFFVSLEDDLMRMFGSERIAGIMDRLGLEEGEMIQHSMVTKSIERAQRKVEENNFGVRKRLLEYDDVMNSQREVIYTRRRNALFGERLSVDIANMIYDTCESILAEFHEARDYQGFDFEVLRVFGFQTVITEEEFNKSKTNEIQEALYGNALRNYTEKNVRIAASAFPVIKNVYESQAQKFINIVVPFTDGVKAIQVVTNLERAFETEGKQLIRDFEKNITLAIIDDSWKEHLRDMDDLRQSVQGAVYEQKDPLLIYKFESFKLFKLLLEKTNKEVVSFLFKGNLPAPDASQVRQAPAATKPAPRLNTSGPNTTTTARGNQPQRQAPPKQQTVVNDLKISRNERVTIFNAVSGEKQTLKYKQAQPMIETGQWQLLDKS